MKKVLFIGNFLSKQKGTINPSEKIAGLLSKDFVVRKVSSFHAITFRALSIVISVFFFRYDRIHIDVFSGKFFFIAYYSFLIAKLRRKKTVIALHGGRLPELNDRKAEYLNYLLKKADKVVSPSRYLQSFFLKKGYSVNYLPNFIDLSLFSFKPERTNEIKLLWVRAFTPIYNPDLAVNVLFEIRKKYPQATLTMVGPDKGNLFKCKELIRESGLDDAVHITGPVPNDQLSIYYQSHSVYLNTTSYESFGVAVLEAACSGIPVVSHAVGEIPLLWKDGYNMMLAEKGNVYQIASKVIQLIEDKELASRIAKNARKKAEEFSWEYIKPKWIELLG